MHRTALATLFTVASLLLGASTLIPAGAQAAGATQLRFGIGDQHLAMFTDERWSAMHLRITRYNIPWDAAEDPEQLTRALNFVTAARAEGVQTLLHVSGQVIDGSREALPTRAEYRKQIRKLVAIFRPMGVRTWGAWNEANHPTQPTISRPDRAAEFFLELRSACIGCTIVALDVLVQGTPRSTGKATYRGYIQRFMTALGKRRSLVKIIGFHNYGELIESKGAYRSRDLTRFARRYVPKARYWITESGGVAATRTRLCDEQRQVLGTQRMFAQARSLQPYGVDRLYMYNWTADDCSVLFDSGLIRQDGTTRPAYAVVLRGAAQLGR